VDLEDEELIFCLENLKAGEISSFKVERVRYTEKKKRILESSRWLIAAMLDWQTVIDLNADRQCMKRVVRRGIGQKRFNVLDEVTFSGRAYQLPEAPVRSFEARAQVVASLEPRVPTTLVDVLMSGKVQEKFEVTIARDYWQRFEKNEEFKALLDPALDLVYEVEIEQIVELLDLFHDGSVLKKITKGSYSTSTPDENSRIYFDYHIFDRTDTPVYSCRLRSGSLQGVPAPPPDPRRHPLDGRARLPAHHSR
jgi:hypothetical protein